MENMAPFDGQQFKGEEYAGQLNYDNKTSDTVALEEGNFQNPSRNEDEAKLPTARRKKSVNICATCGKRFLKPYLLRHHEATHLTEKQFECDVCPNGFNRKSSLLRHVAHLHGGVRNHKCLHCPISFTQKTHLEAHMKKLHPAKPSAKDIKCPHCTCIFRLSFSLSRHKWTRHRDKLASASAQADDDPNAFANYLIADLRSMHNSMTPQPPTACDSINAVESTTATIIDGPPQLPICKSANAEDTTTATIIGGPPPPTPCKSTNAVDTTTGGPPPRTPCKSTNAVGTTTGGPPPLTPCKSTNAEDTTIATIIGSLPPPTPCKSTNAVDTNTGGPPPPKPCKSTNAVDTITGGPPQLTPCKSTNAVEITTAPTTGGHPPPCLPASVDGVGSLTSSRLVTVKLEHKLNPQRAATALTVQCVIRDDGHRYLVCEFCSREFRKSYDLIRHRRGHTAERPYGCDECESHFSTQQQLNVHRKVHVLDERLGIIRKKHECGVCHKCYASVRLLDMHVKTHVSTHSVQYTCSQCHATFGSKRALAAHRHRPVDKELEMLKPLLPEPVCSKVSSSACASLGIARKRNAPVDSHKCKSCGRFYASKTSLSKHQRRIHSKDRDSSLFYSCVQCVQKRFATLVDLRRHQQRTHVGRRYRCAYCMLVHKTRDNCFSHMKTHLRQLLSAQNDKARAEKSANDASAKASTALMVVSQLPDATPGQATSSQPTAVAMPTPAFIEIQMLPQSRQLRHRNIAIVAVPKTDDASSAVGDLGKSEPHDTNAKIFNCPNCTKLFKKANDLERHMTTHTLKRPFACETCGKSFAIKSTLVAHGLTHAPSNERRMHQCQVCGKMYATKKSCNIHQRLHTGAKPLACEHCPSTFRTSRDRSMHMRDTHPLTTPENNK